MRQPPFSTSKPSKPKPQCRECGKDVTPAMKKCPHCGVDDPVPVSISPTKLGFGIAVLAIIWIPVLIVMDTDLGEGDSGTTTSRRFEDCLETGYAETYAENHIKAQLVAPATADFPFLLEPIVGKGYDSNGQRCWYKMRSYVDAQNAFGATVRSNFEVILYHYGGERWEIKDSAITP